ncbi:MAG TPA: DNA polymerase III subunit gamma/tau [Pyrinomonadaceae bacterium]
MSYQVIARKWRPQAFEEVTGQEHITQTIRNALAHDRLHHAYLFSGARGVGKTTTARLLAKALNCHKTDKPNLSPCRTDDPTACPSCTEIAESRSMDVLEIDAASHTGIDDVRETILESININPVRDRFKAFIIDEVHQLSKPAFNALLKTLEEPPPNVVFVLATTELHKVPETIRSRCQEFDFRIIPVQKIYDRVKLIAKTEKIKIEDAALREIARSGMGSMRDAQSNFDQVISFSGENISVTDVSTALGIASAEMLRRILEALREKTPKLALDVVADLISRGQDMRNFCRDLLAVFRDLMVFKVSNGDESLVESSLLTVDEMRKITEHFGEADFLRFFSSLAETEEKLKDAMQPRYVLETGLVKLIEMRRVAPIEELLERLGRLEQGVSSALNPPPGDAAAAATAEKKTLVSEPVTPEPENEPVSDIETGDTGSSLSPLPASAPEKEKKPVVDLLFLDSLPVKLAPIDPEALEHVEDNLLDAAYEKKLQRTGDDLMPIPRASALVDTFLGKASSAAASSSTTNGSTGSAVAPALTTFTPPVFDDPEPSDDLPPLQENASDEEMVAYVSRHPLLRRTMRVFRAKIVEVKRD